VYEDEGTRLERKSWDSKRGIEDCQGNIRADQKQVLKICDIYITELHDQANRPENLKVRVEEEVDADEKGPYVLQSEVKKTVKELWDQKATRSDDCVPAVHANCWEQDDTSDQQHI
jgi:hypothetical protein